MKPEVSIILVNWNGWRDTAECLTSLLAVGYDNFQVIISDNGSTDGSLEKAGIWCRQNQVPLFLVDGPSRTVSSLGGEPDGRTVKKLYFIQNHRNLGFTGANNQGLYLARRLGSEYYLLLNNDTLVTPAFLGRMVETAQKDSQIGLLGCKILYARPEGGRFRIWSAGEKTRGYGNFKAVGQDDFDNHGFTGLKETYYVCGCCLLIKKATAEQIGFLDDFFFFLAEDLEYSLRAQKSGWKTLVDLDAVIHHKVGRGREGLNALAIYYYTRNVAQARKKHYSFRESAWFWLGHPLHHVLALGVKRCLSGRQKESLAAFLGFLDFLRRRGGPCRYGLITNRPK